MNQPPSFPDPDAQPLPDASTPDASTFEGSAAGDLLRPTPPRLAPDPDRDRRHLRQILLGLLAVGLGVGLLTATGVVWLLHRFDLAGVPTLQESPGDKP